MAGRLRRSLRRALGDPAQGLRALERLDCEAGLLGFARHAWALLEPGRDFVPGWHLEVLSEHLEAVTRGEIPRLLINVPPGTMKSLTVAVLWPAWEWGPAGRPELRTIAASYAERLSLRDNMKCRRLVASDWYRGHWGRRVRLVGDQNAKGKFENDRTGFRLATSVGGLGTGERGDRFVIDDPHNVQQAESAAVREATLRWFSETVPTRLNDSRSAIVVVMQRVHERDVSGLILARELGYEHLLLPMRYEPERRCVTRLGIADRRRRAGELLWPARFPEPAVAALEQALGAYAAAGQLQQRPAPRDGGLFRRHWFELVDALPAGCRVVRGWVLAASRAAAGRDPDWTAGVKLARAPDGLFYLADVVRLRGSGLEVERAILASAQQDGTAVAISLPRDPGQAGKVQADWLLRRLAGFTARATPESGDKTTRAAPVAAQAEAGNVKLLRGPWNEAFLEEAALFPTGAHDDQIDALARAFAALLEGGREPQVFA